MSSHPRSREGSARLGARCVHTRTGCPARAGRTGRTVSRGISPPPLLAPNSASLPTSQAHPWLGWLPRSRPEPGPARRPRLLFWPRRERTIPEEEVPGCWRLPGAGLGGAQAAAAAPLQPPHSLLPFPATRLRAAHLKPGAGLPGAAAPATGRRWSLRYPERRSPPPRASEPPRGCASARRAAFGAGARARTAQA